MSFAQLKDEAARLQPAEQRKLIAFLVAEQAKKDDEFKQAMARKIDGNDPAHWMDLDEAHPPKRRAGLHPGAMIMSDDFDVPLPDSFWLGEDA